MKTIRADFDSGFAPTLKLWDNTTGALSYSFLLAESLPTEPGSYFKTETFITGRYRAGLEILGSIAQRSRIYVGPDENTIYHLGNWEGSIDVGAGYYLAGVGAFVVTITIKDNLNVPIQNANVSLYRTGDQRHGVTNVNGQVVFNSDAVTWTNVAIVASGYTFAAASLTVTANTNVTYSGVPIVPILPPLTNQQVHVQAYVFNEYGVLENGVLVNTKMIQPSTLSGIFDKKKATFASIGGIVTLTNLFQGAWYDIWRGRSTPMKYYVPIVSAGTTTVNCDPILGDDELDPCL